MPAKNRMPEITGEYPELAQLVRRITGDVSRMAAARVSGVSHDSIARLWRGDRVGPNILLKFAQGYRVDSAPLFRAADYDPFAPVPLEEIVYAPDPDVIPVPEGYHDVDGPARQAAVAAAQQAYKAVVDALRTARQTGTIGALRSDEHTGETE